VEEVSDLVLWGVVAVAFIAGYTVIGFIVKRLKDLKNRPSVMDEIWREDPASDKSKPLIGTGLPNGTKSDQAGTRPESVLKPENTKNHRHEY
jgi:hypothetical protein